MITPEGASTFSTIVTAINPIFIALLGFLQVSKSKKDDKYRKLQAEKEELEAKNKQQRDREATEQMDKLKATIGKLSNEVEQLQDNINIERIERQLSQLHTLNELNFGYIKSLSGVVLSIGEVLSSSDAIKESDKDKLQEEIRVHKAEEKKISEQLYKIIM